MENESPESILWLSVFENRGGNSPGDMETAALAANRAVALYRDRPKQAPAPAPESVSFPGRAANLTGTETFTDSGDVSEAVLGADSGTVNVPSFTYLRALAAAYLAADPDCTANPDGSGEWSIDDVAEAVEELRAGRDKLALEVYALRGTPAVFSVREAISETDLPADMSSADAIRTLWGLVVDKSLYTPGPLPHPAREAMSATDLPHGLTSATAIRKLWRRLNLSERQLATANEWLRAAAVKAGAYGEIREALGFVDETPTPAEVVALARKASDALTDAASADTPGPSANVKLRAGLAWALNLLCELGIQPGSAAAATVDKYEALLVQLADAEPDTDWAKVCASVGLVEGCSADRVIECIDEMKREMGEANETLAAYCPECDPSRCSLPDTVGLLVSDVLEPLRKSTPTGRPDSLAHAIQAAAAFEPGDIVRSRHIAPGTLRKVIGVDRDWLILKISETMRTMLPGAVQESVRASDCELVARPRPEATPTVHNGAALAVAHSLRAVAHATIGDGYLRQALDLIDGARHLLGGVSNAEDYAGHYAWIEMRSCARHTLSFSFSIAALDTEQSALLLVVAWCSEVLRGAR